MKSLLKALKQSRGLKVAVVLSYIFFVSASVAQDEDLIETITQIEAQLNARIGVAAYSVGSDLRWQYHADDRFPMSSTFKTLACAALLHRVDSNQENLERVVKIETKDIVSYSPITETRLADAGMTLAELCEATITVSDNTASNLVLGAIGGPEGLTRFMRSIGDEVTRLDRMETQLNEGVPGDLRDTTTPNAMANAMENLVLGDVLSASSRAQLEAWLRGDTVADALFRAGIPASWEIGDKTGAGGYGSRSIAAIMWPPSGNPIVATVYITETEALFDDRNSAIAQIGAAIAKEFAQSNGRSKGSE